MADPQLEVHGIDPLRDTIEFAPTSFAQYGEDLILWRALNDITRGFYIDVGAMDPIRDSVTKLFYDRGWNGINIEPVRKWVNRLVKNRPLDITVPLAVSDGRETVTLHEVLDSGLSTVVDDFARDYADKGLEVRTYKVAADTISAICERHVKGQIHFMKLDVEGAERDALVGCNFQRFRPWILAIESTIPCTYTAAHEEWESIVLAAGYRFALFEKINRYYVAEEHAGRIDRIQKVW